MSTTQNKGKKNRKYGRAARKPKNARYNAGNRRYHNKLKRVKQSCGEDFARDWVKKFGRTRARTGVGRAAPGSSQ